VLNKFSGGPLDGMVYTSSSLLDDPRLTHFVNGYSCTGTIVHSQATNAVARVWELSATVDTSRTTTQNGASPVTAPETTESTEAAEAPAPEAPPVDASGIVQKRKDLKLSRTPVAAQAQITVAQLARIENGGKRTTQAEVDQVNAALDALALQVQAAQAAAPTPAPEGSADPA
jgi:DNA-binding transcriptional regulator YiaG